MSARVLRRGRPVDLDLQADGLEPSSAARNVEYRNDRVTRAARCPEVVHLRRGVSTVQIRMIRDFQCRRRDVADGDSTGVTLPSVHAESGTTIFRSIQPARFIWNRCSPGGAGGLCRRLVTPPDGFRCRCRLDRGSPRISRDRDVAIVTTPIERIVVEEVKRDVNADLPEMSQSRSGDMVRRKVQRSRHSTELPGPVVLMRSPELMGAEK